MRKLPGIVLIVTLISLLTPSFSHAALPEIYQGFPEETDAGKFLCGIHFWRGLPPCLKETAQFGAYVRYPTREKAKIILDSYLVDGFYSEGLLVSLFGSLATGSYQPIKSVPASSYWDSAFFALVKLDYRLEAKQLLMDVVLDRDWATGRFIEDRYKALDTLSTERLITLKEYKPLVEMLNKEIQSPNPNVHWINSMIFALSSFREWNEELLPILRNAFNVITPGFYRPVLKAFLDFETRDDAAFIMSQILDGKVTDLNDQKLCIRAAYVLDYEAVLSAMDQLEKKPGQSPELLAYCTSVRTRLNWFGNWEILDAKDTFDAGLKDEQLVFKMAYSLDEKEDIANFTMMMSISDDLPMKPIGMDDLMEGNGVSFECTKDELTYVIYDSASRSTHRKVFKVSEGKGRGEEGKVYLKFEIPGEVDAKGTPKLGHIVIEKVSV